MQERFPRPAPKVTESEVNVVSAENETSIPLRYLELFRCRQGKLVSLKEMVEYHSHLPRARVVTPQSVLTTISELRTKYLQEGEMIKTILSRRQGTVGFLYSSSEEKDQEVNTLSDMGVSPHRDKPGKLKIVPEFSVLSTKIEQNLLIDSRVVVSLIDRMSPKDSRNLQSPYLSLTERRLVAFLTEHPEGIPAERFLKEGLGIRLPDLQRDRALIDHQRSALSRKSEGRLRIYFLAPFFGPGEKVRLKEGRYFLVSKEKIGKQVRIPIFEESEFEFLPKPTRKLVEDLYNCFFIGERKLKGLSPPERRLLLYLAHNYGTPCSLIDSVRAAYPTAKFPLSRLDALRTKKKLIQKALRRTKEGEKFRVITASRCFDEALGIPLEMPIGVYILDHQSSYQEERVKIPFLPPTDFIDVDKKIRTPIRAMLFGFRRDKKDELNFWPEVTPKERKVLLALGRSFPHGCQAQVLALELFPESKYDYSTRELNRYISQLRTKLGEEFGEEFSIMRDKGEYRLEVAKEK